jgi:hypothetical protein
LVVSGRLMTHHDKYPENDELPRSKRLVAWVVVSLAR